MQRISFASKMPKPSPRTCFGVYFLLSHGLETASYFGERVKEQRSKLGLTLEELATKLGVKKTRVSMWETNGIVPRSDVLSRLAEIFGVSIEYLLGTAENKNGTAENADIAMIHRNLGKLNEEQLGKAKEMLKLMFDKFFEDEEEHRGV